MWGEVISESGGNENGGDTKRKTAGNVPDNGTHPTLRGKDI
jgi:hypothetical protein